MSVNHWYHNQDKIWITNFICLIEFIKNLKEHNWLCCDASNEQEDDVVDAPNVFDRIGWEYFQVEYFQPKYFQVCIVVTQL